MNPCANPNPRVGVLLRLGKASVRLFNILNPRFGRRGLVWFQKHWPEARLRKEIFGYGGGISREWNAILKARGHPYYEEPPTKLLPIWRAKNAKPPTAGWFYVRQLTSTDAPVGIRYYDDSDGTWWLPSISGMSINNSFSEWLQIRGLK